MAKFGVILPAAGKSTRFGGKTKKQFATLDGRPVWVVTVERFVNRDDVCQIILTVAPEDRESFVEKYSSNVAFLGIDVVTGGETRSRSVANALERLNDEVEFVCIHDAVRPCVTDELIDKVFAQAQQVGAAILAVPVAATLKRVENGRIVETVSREGLWEAQTPQVFRRDLIVEAFRRFGHLDVTDDAQLVEQLGKAVEVVPSSPLNIKISTRDDLRLAEQILKVVLKPKPKGPFHPFAEDDMWR